MSSTANSATAASTVSTVASVSQKKSSDCVEVITDDDDDDMAPVTTLSTKQSLTHKHVDSLEGTSVSTSSENSQIKGNPVLKTPPFNLVMENVSKYLDFDETWLSEVFYSHQIGYKICLAVRLESSSEGDGMVNVILGVTSAEGPHSRYLVYPCSGFAKLLILNPKEDSGHQALELPFSLETPIKVNGYSEIEGEAVKIPQYFIVRKEFLFFQVEQISVDKAKHALWLLDAAFVEGKQRSDEESSEDF